MQLIKIVHADFELVVECNNIEAVFNRALKKHSNFHHATTYRCDDGSIWIYSFDTLQLEEFDGSETYPLIFENKDYVIGITFRDISLIDKPRVYAPLQDHADKFTYRANMGFLVGTINFGNDLGKSVLDIRYEKDGVAKQVEFGFEVFPTKLDYKQDYSKMLSDLERVFPNLVLDFLRKTYSSFTIENTCNSDLIWWQIFQSIYDEFIASTRYILSKPHSRITIYHTYQKADKIQRWSTTLEENFAQAKNLPQTNYRCQNKALCIDTAENRFFKHALWQSCRRFKKIRQFIKKRYSRIISVSALDKMDQMQKQLDTMMQNPLFKNIGFFQGIRQESLVLQKATGYSSLYKCWMVLSSGFKLLEGSRKVELKNIAELYQAWCFLEIRAILQKILEDHVEEQYLADVGHVNDLVHSLETGLKSRVAFIASNAQKVELFHDYCFGVQKQEDLISFTVRQKPDIVLRISKQFDDETYTFTYVFDAKYRLDSPENTDMPDWPTEDSINQAHRYRDAIYTYNPQTNKPEREVLGAYILFPGSGRIEDIKQEAYYKSIDCINIGAFPLKPNETQNRALLEDHLRVLLNSELHSILRNTPAQKYF